MSQFDKYTIRVHGWDQFNFQLYREFLKAKATLLTISIRSGIMKLQMEKNYKRPQYTNQ